MKTSIKFTALAALALAFASCSSDEPNGRKEPARPYPTISEISFSRAERQAYEGLNGFSSDFFNAAIVNAGNQNITISPISMAMCLSMIANSCDELKEAEILKMMNCESLDDLNSVCRQLMQYLPDAINKSDLWIANSVWHKQDMTASEDFVNRMSENYFANVSGVDFSSKAAADAINRWCLDNTNNLIKCPADLSKNLRLLVLNAVYFADKWDEPFEAKQTTKQTFHGINGDVKIDMMHGKRQSMCFDYGTFKSFTLWYKGTACMDIYLPNEGLSHEQFIEDFVSADLSNPINRGFLANANLVLPKFSIDSNIDCRSIFSDMGLTFDISNLNKFAGGYDGEYILNVKQAIKLSVDETGTKAAAVTSGEILDTGMDVPRDIDFICDRPFIYVIRNTNMRSILMAGQFAQPE